MMRVLSQLLTILCVPFLYSCAPAYVPNARNVPMFNNGGEFYAVGSMGTAGTNIQTAVAVTNHLAFAAGGHYANNKSQPGWAYRSHRAAEAGVGYYVKKRASFEIFGGLGFGKGYAQDSTSGFLAASVPETISGRYSRIFLQPSLGMTRRLVEGSITTRMSWVRFSELDYSRNGMGTALSKRPRVFFEPSFTFRAYPGGGHIFLSGQAGATLFINADTDEGYSNDQYFDYSPFQFSVGVGVRFGRKTVVNNDVE